MIFEFRKRIYGFECDIYGHLNNANYLQLLESARTEAMDEMDISVSKMLGLNLQIFIRHFTLDYRLPLELEDVVTVRSWFDEINRVKGHWVQQIFNSRGELCFEAGIVAVFASEGKARRLPQEIYELFNSFRE